MDVSQLWAKTLQDPGEPERWHPLLLHLLDVAAAADAILDREPESTRRRMGEVLGLEWIEARPWLLFVIACHDLGKACPSFQAKWAGRLPLSGLQLPKMTDPRVRHGYVSQIVLADILRSNGWPEDLAELTSEAVGCHHGERASEKNRRDAIREIKGQTDAINKDWVAARSGLVDALIHVFNPSRVPKKTTLTGPDFMLVAGLTSFADWIGSNEEWFTFGTVDDCADTSKWFTQRRDQAEQALDAVGWAHRSPLLSAPKEFQAIFDKVPRPLQQAMIEMLVTIDEPGVVLVEAPMGEGKTEAAFFAHLELQRRFGHRGMYVALPSKATGNAMFTRAVEFLAKHSTDRHLDLQLLHGAKLLNDEFQRLRFSRIGDELPGAEVRAAEWFTNKKRALLSEYGVGTLDQALVAILPVRHHFVRLWGLANRVVILDEIHAYDAYTGTLLQRLITWLQALGSSVVLLSATLSPSIRRNLAKATGSRLPDQEAAYPRLSHFLRGGEARQRHFEAAPERRLTVQLRGIAPEVSTIRSVLEQALAAGGMGLALVNTVDRAQKLYQAFPDGEPIVRDGVRVGKRLGDGTTVLLFHARFPAHLRQVREEAVIGTFGPSVEPRVGRCILIATQVAEQSLDLDFDAIVTDLAPIDLLLQRAGRLWRHMRSSRPVSEPVLFVAGLEPDQPPGFLQPLWWGKVYREDLLLLTWAMLRTRRVLMLPDDIDGCVAAVYEGEVHIPVDLEERFEKARNIAEGEACADRTKAHTEPVGFPDDGTWKVPKDYTRFDEDEAGVHRSLIAQTRLGEDAVVAVPLWPDDGFQADILPSPALAKEWYLRGVSLSRGNVVRELNRLGRPGGWEKSPLLRGCVPLLLDSESRWLQNQHVRLDQDLGIVYDPKEGA